MFEKKGESSSAAPAQPITPSSGTGIIVHVMPQQFYGREISVPVRPASSPVTPAATPLPPQIAPPPPPAVKPQPVKPPEPRRRSRLPLIVAVLSLLLLCVGAGVIGYVFFILPNAVTTPPVTTPPVTTPPVTEPTEPEPGKDTDSDGLTDVEELMYGTDYRDPDTDKDTYLDGNEVFHGYDPNGLAPLTLISTGAVRILQNAQIPFTVYYPSVWTPVISAATNNVTIRPSSTESFVVSWQPKDPTLPLGDWFDANVKDGSASADLKATYTRMGLYELTSTDGRLSYLDGGDKVYIFTYDLGDEDAIQYLQTFEMLVNSFTLLP